MEKMKKVKIKSPKIWMEHVVIKINKNKKIKLKELKIEIAKLEIKMPVNGIK